MSHRFYHFSLALTIAASIGFSNLSAQTATLKAPKAAANRKKVVDTDWHQWRGPNRDGKLQNVSWPDKLDDSKLKKSWSMPLGPSYSGPIVVGDTVYTTQTKDQRVEVVTAIDRKTGKQKWTQQWKGAMNVPFFAAANGSWIRSTPAYSDGMLYVAGIRDHLFCLNAKDGKVVWEVNFPKEMGSALPNFGCVCSPLIDGNDLYVQAGGAFCKLNKKTGEIIWKGLTDGGGMNGSAFSSPVIATVAGKRQALVQTRSALAGVDLKTGETLWSQRIKTFRGMNIITPTVAGKNSLFVSTYGGTTQLINLQGSSGSFSVSQKWNLPAEGYMTTPVIVGDYAYTHLRNQRFACYDLKNGVEKWRSRKRAGKYVSLIAAGDKVMALDQKGKLMMFKANPEKFELLDSRKTGSDSWAHLAVSGNQVFIRNLNELVAYEWVK